MATKNLRDMSFYFITDRELSGKSEVEQVREAIQGGSNIIQYRDKKSSKETLLRVASELKRICDEKNAIFIVNDHVDIANIVDADGVHIGQSDMAYKQARALLKDKIIGVTVHNIAEAVETEMVGADYLGVSPIFETTTKKDAGKPLGVALLMEVKKSVRIPVIAIGGINTDNVDLVIEAGADSVCAISATVIGNIASNVRFFVDKLKAHHHQYSTL